MSRHQREARRRSERRRLLVQLGSGAALLLALGAVLILHSGGQSAAAAQAQGPSISVVAPADSAIVTSPVHFEVAVKGASLGQPMAGKDHLHISIDGGPAIAEYQDTEMSIPLKPGPHTIAVELAGPDHDGIAPIQAVSFTVTG